MRGHEVRLTFKWYAIGDTRQMRSALRHDVDAGAVTRDQPGDGQGWPALSCTLIAVWAREDGAWKFNTYQPTPIINNSRTASAEGQTRRPRVGRSWYLPPRSAD